MEIDDLGLDDVDRRILRIIIEKFAGGPVGLDTLAAAISEDSATIMDVYEPYLIQLGFIDRTPRGRTCTEHAYSHLDIAFPANNQTRDSSAFYETCRFRLRFAAAIHRADAPATRRDSSRLMRAGALDWRYLPSCLSLTLSTCLRPKDVVVLNNTRVIPARLQARKAETGGASRNPASEKTG